MMSKKGIQRKKPSIEAEVTLLDCADAQFAKRKLSKGVILNFKKLQRDLEESKEDDAVSPTKVQKKRKAKNEEDSNHVYNDYHIDIWFLISEFIRPEDVRRFALICKKTEAVIASAKFWSSLYHRYFNPRIRLPEILTPHSIVRIGGLRSRVIRALFYMYPPFTQRLQAAPSSILLKLECMGTWYKQEDKIWIFCYKFSNRIKTRQPFKRLSFKDDEDDDDFEDFLSQYNNVFENAHEGNHLLVVFSKRFIPLPDFHGQRAFISLIRQPLSQDLRHLNLELKFSNYAGVTVATVLYESVLKSRVISWWDPDYDRVIS